MTLHRASLIVILVAFAVIGCNTSTSNKTDQTPKEKTPKEKAAERLAGAADLTLTADELGKEQNKDGA